MRSSDTDLFTVEGLAKALRETENGSRSEGAPRERLEIALHHRHLPKLAESGFVEFDAGTGDVRYRENTHDIVDSVFDVPDLDRLLS